MISQPPGPLLGWMLLCPWRSPRGCGRSPAPARQSRGQAGPGTAQAAAQSRMEPGRLAAIPQQLVASLASLSLGSCSGQEHSFPFYSEHGELLPAALASWHHQTAKSFTRAGPQHPQMSGSQGCSLGAGRKVVPTSAPSWLCLAASGSELLSLSQEQSVLVAVPRRV